MVFRTPGPASDRGIWSYRSVEPVQKKQEKKYTRAVDHGKVKSADKASRAADDAKK